MNNYSEHEKLLDDIIEYKENAINKLLTILSTEDDPCLLNKVAFVLVDHIKDDNIATTLEKRIKSQNLRNKNGTLLYLLGEYTNDKKYLIFLLDLILENNNDGEIFMSAYSMIINLHPPLDIEDILNALHRLRQEKSNLDNSPERMLLIHSLLNYFEGQKGIAEFYQQFNAD